jgi:hypothetical protein
MKPSVRVLASLIAALVIGPAMAQVPSPAPTSAPIHSTAPPGLQRFQIRQDTYDEREAFLKRRQAEQDQRKIQEVSPLPAQIIAPPSSPR